MKSDSTASTEIKVSILVPVYNTEKFLPECLTSLINQTLKDIEIICVNDGSTDSSLSILEEYSKIDSRIKIISYTKNEGLMRARWHALKKASGQYIQFVDSDDFLSIDACEKAYNGITKYNVDILHFSTNVVPYGHVALDTLQGIEPYVYSYCHKLTGKSIFNSCFNKLKFGWNLWNKIYKTEVVKKVIDYIPENNCIMGEDMFIFSLICHFASTYYGIKEKLYNYRFGSGVSTVAFDKKQFVSFAKKYVAIKNMKDFLIKVDDYKDDRKKFIDETETEFYSVLCWHFYKSIPESSGAACFDYMVELLGIRKTIEVLFKINDVYALAKRIDRANFFEGKEKDFKNIAIFYFNYGRNGGIERVISMLIPLLHNLGYNLTLITEKKPEIKNKNKVITSNYSTPSYCKHIKISQSTDVKDIKDYLKHGDDFTKVIKENNIDLVLYQASNSPFMIYDLFIAKSLGAYFVPTIHDFITSPLLYSGKHFSWKPKVLKLCDCVQTITRLEEEIYLKNEVNAKYIPNPLTFEVEDSLQSHFVGKKVLWVGRIDDLQKNPNDALDIIVELKRYIPDIMLTIIGSGTEDRNKHFERAITAKSLFKNVTWIKKTEHPEDYYKDADVLLMTSSYEVYPMVIGEAMSYGLPIVSYSMDYIELFIQNKDGVIQTDQRNILLTANALLEVLTNKELHDKMSKASYNAIKKVNSYDISKDWINLLNSLKDNNHYLKETKIDKVMSNYLSLCYESYYYPKYYYGTYEETFIVYNLFRYFKKFGIKATYKKIMRFIKRNGFKAALKKGRIKLN